MIARLTALVFTGVTLLMPSVAKTEEVAQFNMSGETLADDCRVYMSNRRNPERQFTTAEDYQAGRCYGFVTGVMDLDSGLNAWHAISADRQTAFCTAAVDGHAVTATVAIYLDQHPEERNTAAFFLVRKILAEKFPC